MYKTGLIYHDGLWRNYDAAEYAILEWVAWFNAQRLLAPIWYLPPGEYEQHFHRAQATQLATSART